MSQNRGAADDHVPPTPTDELAAHLARSLQAHAAVHTPDPAVVAARLRAASSGREGVVVPLRRGGRVVAATVVTGTLAVAGAGAAAAANPYSGVARAVEGVAQAVGVDWSFMPEGYDREQYEAFWGAGYGVADMEALAELWQTDLIETKARAGQMLLDGQTPPVLPGSVPETGDGQLDRPGYRPDVSGVPGDRPVDELSDVEVRAWAAFWDAGYTEADLEALVALWQDDVEEVKTRAGRMVLDSEPLPIAPGSTAP
ncbi:hypothetical protein [Cellulomonas sp. S1-8]|uniref:hypothetical protein n=1 Tax=Cellulomonas sp. S1-8 TaxID=2904790 RepID=UPI002244E899|nr:hypothetical protein [Cellulomonas sp. S1-8]UZN02844.1 hypothetical protein OKX07_17595 [Cellulomonas sp. S1-8]